jgi:hypothetical protein
MKKPLLAGFVIAAIAALSINAYAGTKWTESQCAAARHSRIIGCFSACEIPSTCYNVCIEKAWNKYYFCLDESS